MLDQQEATLAKNRAQLRQAEANLARDIAQEQYAIAQANRYVKLTQEGVISRAERAGARQCRRPVPGRQRRQSRDRERPGEMVATRR